MKLAVIVPAAGSGSRMNSTVAKPFLPLGNKTVLGHTLSHWFNYRATEQVIIPTQPHYINDVRAIIEALNPSCSVHVIEGGVERQDSISNAITVLRDDIELVAVHDAVRPFADSELIDRVAQAALEFDAAIPVIPSRDTIKRINEKNQVELTLDRTKLVSVQTPQIIKKSLFVAAYAWLKAHPIAVTDDASVLEAFGAPVTTVEGSLSNIKITYPIDYQWATFYLTHHDTRY